MTREAQIKTIYEFIKHEHLCVISTVNKDGKPEGATMAYSETPDLKLIFSTSTKTRKYENLLNNPDVAVVIGWDFNKYVTVQYNGIAKMEEGEQKDTIRNIHITKNEESKKYAFDPENRYYIVEPKWIRYWSVKENLKFELEF